MQALKIAMKRLIKKRESKVSQNSLRSAFIRNGTHISKFLLVIKLGSRYLSNFIVYCILEAECATRESMMQSEN